jgi:hypothetical protein
MEESMLAAMQRQQIEVAVGELLLNSDFYMQQSIVEHLRLLISHADHSLDINKLSEVAQDELREHNLLPPEQSI